MALADRLEGWGRNRWTRALRTCGLRRPAAGRPRSGPECLYCNLKICPICRARTQKRRFAQHRVRAQALMGLTGSAVFITLTCPSDGRLDDRIKAILAAMRRWQNRQAWKSGQGGRKRVGLVWVLELEPGTKGQGHPHIHQLVFAACRSDLEGFTTAMLAHWERCFPAVGSSFAQVDELSGSPEDWAPRLHYILKGSRVEPDWPDAVFDAAVLELTSGRQHGAAIGLMRAPRLKREQGAYPDVHK